LIVGWDFCFVGDRNEKVEEEDVGWSVEEEDVGGGVGDMANNP
jgi:hypothetical protein